MSDYVKAAAITALILVAVIAAVAAVYALVAFDGVAVILVMFGGFVVAFVYSETLDEIRRRRRRKMRD